MILLTAYRNLNLFLSLNEYFRNVVKKQIYRGSTEAVGQLKKVDFCAVGVHGTAVSSRYEDTGTKRRDFVG